MRPIDRTTTTSRETRTRTLAAASLAVAAATLLGHGASAQDTMRVRFGEGAQGDRNVPVIVTATHSQEIHGYSIALSFPPEAFTASSLGISGTDVAAMEPDFVAPRIDNELGVATLGVIVNYDEPVGSRSLQPTAGIERIIARLSLNVRQNAPGGFHPLRLIDGIGRPSAYNRFTTAGTSVVPELQDGTFFVAGGNVLCVEKKIAFAGASPNLEVFAFAQHSAPLSGFQVGFDYDCTALNLLEGTQTGTDMDFELGVNGLIEFFQWDIDDTIGDSTCQSRTGVIFDFLEPFDGQTLSPSPDGPYNQSVVRYRFNVGAAADDEAEFQDLFLRNRPDTPGAFNNAFLIGTTSVLPHRIHGKIYFSFGSLTGRVVSKVTGAPVSDARVVTEPDGFEGLTNVDGVFRIDDVIPGSYSLKIGRDGFYTGLFTDVQVTGRGTVDNAGSFAIFQVPTGGGGRNDVFRRGYLNPDERSDISDAIWLLDWLFKGGAPPPCMLAADINDDDQVDLSDPIWLLTWLFSGGEPIPPPVDACGTDPTTTDPAAMLDCEFTIACN